MRRLRGTSLRSLVRPTTRYVWIVGPDGCGKSTVAAQVAARSGALLLYWRPSVLPMAGRLLGRSTEDGVNSTPHEVTTNHPVKSTLRLLYYALDYVLGYWIVIRPSLASGRPVLVERGWWDMVVDHRRYGLGGSGLARWLGRVIKKPDIVVLMSAEPAVIRSRKPELPVEEIARQLRDWRELSWSRTQVVVVDNERALSTVVDEVADIVGHRAVVS